MQGGGTGPVGLVRLDPPPPPLPSPPGRLKLLNCCWALPSQSPPDHLRGAQAQLPPGARGEGWGPCFGRGGCEVCPDPAAPTQQLPGDSAAPRRRPGLLEETVPWRLSLRPVPHPRNEGAGKVVNRAPGVWGAEDPPLGRRSFRIGRPLGRGSHQGGLSPGQKQRSHVRPGVRGLLAEAALGGQAFGRLAWHTKARMWSPRHADSPTSCSLLRDTQL